MRRGLVVVEQYPTGGEKWIGSGYYEDEFRREGGSWKFVVRDSTLVKWERVR